MNIYLILFGLIAFVLGAGVLAVQLYRRRMFSMMTFAAGFFLIEAVGGTLKALFPGEVLTDYAASDVSNPIAWVPRALLLYLVGFSLFVYGYAITSWLLRVGKRHRDAVTEDYFERVWTPSYRLLLAAVSVFALLVGFVQQFQRVRVAGGLSEFAENAYKRRWGTGTETASETAIVVVANLASIAAVAFAVIWMIAWLRGKLTWVGKCGVILFLLLLYLRQWSTLFRGPLIFTSLSLFAAYAAERRLRMRPLVIAAAVLAVLFLAVNFVHLYMYYLTAGWQKPSIAMSMAQFVAPHGHLYSLATILSADKEGVPHLGGIGMIESLFFFIPRSIWSAKAPSGSYGTVLVQGWAGLPTHYQMAVTTVGEMFAHFSWFGVALMTVFGMLYGVYDSFAERSIELRAGLYGILLARVMPDFGMGLSAICITIVCFGLFLGQAYAARWGSAFIDWVFRGTRRFLRRTPGPSKAMG